MHFLSVCSLVLAGVFCQTAFAGFGGLVKNAQKAVEETAKKSLNVIGDAAEQIAKSNIKDAEKLTEKVAQNVSHEAAKGINKTVGAINQMSYGIRKAKDKHDRAAKKELKKFQNILKKNVPIMASSDIYNKPLTGKPSIDMRNSLKQNIIEVLRHPLFEATRFFSRFTILCKNSSAFHDLVSVLTKTSRSEAVNLMRSDMCVIVSFRRDDLKHALKTPHHSLEVEQYMRTFGIMASTIALHRYAKSYNHQVYPFFSFPHFQVEQFIPDGACPIFMYGVSRDYAKSSIYGKDKC